METFIFTFAILLLVIVGASVGVVMGRKPIKGSCGGVGAALGEKDYICPVCGDDPNKCENEEKKGKTASEQGGDLAYELPKR
ncbi:(Na+)-NQR maturation NqrM [Motiliproteus sp. SC1-56]|uniref:(Na+)-NQR maturation NqrM n=1 Tax=Motiliproteus sp. SC1-56 TaxID=2799565 RepID=UPI001A8DD8E0|nr:(Na+)-NQR maturation NqrM [Motiliproteus sp. SC1-56]